MKVAGRTIAATGGGNGIGRELVLELLDRGARVAALDRSVEALARTAELAGDRAEHLSTHTVDITDRAAVAELPVAIIAEHGQVDGLVNCAGVIQPFVRFYELDREAMERVMDVNFWGVVNTTEAFLPHLCQRPAAHLVNVSSMGGFLPVPGQTVYGASKAAVRLLTEGLYAELKDTNVSVTLVFPGAIKTDISKNSGVEMEDDSTNEKPSHKMLEASKAADMIVKGMLKKKLYVYVGSDSKMMNKIYRLAPKKATDMIAKRMEDLLE